jgi:hypothetical protein
MLERLKAALVDSFVGVIALGCLFADGISHGVNMFIQPFAQWIMLRQYWEVSNRISTPPVFPFKTMFSEFLTSVFLLLIAYGLLRWLYFPASVKPDQKQLQ